MSPRHHRKLRRSLHALVDEEVVEGPARPALLVHLGECEGCRDEFGFLQSLKASLQRIGQRRPTPLAVTRLDHWTIDRFS